MARMRSRRAVLAALGGLGGVSVGSYYYFWRGDPTVRVWLIELFNAGPAESVDIELLKDGERVLDDTYDLPHIDESLNPYARDYPNRDWDISDVNPLWITPTWEPTEAEYRVRYRRSDRPYWNELTLTDVNYEHVGVSLTFLPPIDGFSGAQPPDNSISTTTYNLQSESFARQSVEEFTLPESPTSDDI